MRTDKGKRKKDGKRTETEWKRNGKGAERKLPWKRDEKQLVHIQLAQDVRNCAGFARRALTRGDKWHTI